MAAVQSLTTQAMSVSSSIVLNKPSGLAVGDLMVAVLINQNGITASPTGFTAVTTAAGTPDVAVQYKVADSSDIAASNFTWTVSGDWGGGVLYRITGFNTSDEISSAVNAISTGSNQNTFALTVTPPVADCILIFAGGTYITTTNSPTFSAYSVVTDNPTWTESLDSFVQDSGTTAGGFCAYAIRNAVTATGDASFTSSNSFTDSSAVMVCIYSTIPVNVTDTITTSESILKTLAKIITDTISTVETFIKEKTRLWRNESKPTTVWIDEDK